MFDIIIDEKGGKYTVYRMKFAYGRDIIVATLTELNELAKPDPGKVLCGTAERAEEDVYDRRRGQIIALTRVLAKAKLDKETRIAVWKEYQRRYMHNTPKPKAPDTEPALDALVEAALSLREAAVALERLKKP